MAGVDVGTAYLTVVPSFKNFGSKLSSQLDSGAGFGAAGKKAGDAAGKGFGGSFSSGVKSAVGSAAVLLGGLGAVNFLKDSVGEAREAQKVGALTEQVIKTTGGAAAVTAKQVESLSTAISNKTGIDDEQIQSSANMLLTFTNVKNQVGDGNDVFNQATQTITDMSAALGQDGKTSAVQLGKALNDPVKGITALQRVGVAFTAQQKDQIKAMVASGDTIGAQKVILGELNKEFGGAAEASSTAGEKMKVAFGNVKEQLGTALLPVLDKFAGVMTNKVFPAVSGVIGILAEGAFNGDMGFEEDSGFVTFLFNVRQAVIDIFGVLKNNDANLDTTLMTPMQKFGVFLLKARDLTKVVFQQIKFGIEGIARGFQTGVSDSDGFIGFMERAGIVARDVFDYLKVAIPPIIAAAVALWPAIKQIGLQLFEASKGSGLSTFQLLKAAFEALPGILNAILPLVESLARWMGENQEFVSALVVALTAGVAAFKVLAVVARAYAVVQGILNVVMAANPIGLIVIAIAALVAGLIYAYQNSETFRNVVDGAFQAIGQVIQFTWNTIIQPVLKFFLEMIANIMRTFGDFLIMLGNVPGFEWAREAGEKIKGAADQVTLLSDKIQKIPNKTVYVTVEVDAALAAEGKVAGVIAGIAARAGRNASGTPYWRGGLTWVGEEGPELLNLPRGSQILSNEDSRALVASQATVFQPTVSPTSAVKGEPTVMQNFNGPIVAHDYDDFRRKMADQRRLGALAGRRA